MAIPAVTSVEVLARPWVLAAVFLTAVAINAFDYSVLVPRQDVRIAAHRAVIDGTAPAAAQRRLLVPWVLEPVIRAVAWVMPEDRALTRSYAAFHWLGLAGVLAAIYAYARLWFTPAQAMSGALLAGATLRLLLRQGEYWDHSPIPHDSVFAPSSIAGAVCIGIGLRWLYEGRAARLAALTAVAALNSESSVLLPLAAIIDRAHLGTRGAAATGATWLAVTAMLVGVFGVDAPAFTWDANLQHVPHAIVNNALFLGPSAALLLIGWRTAPPFARTMVLATSALAVPLALWGYWWEVRVLMPGYAVVMPVLLSALWPPSLQSENSLANSTHSP